MLELTDCQLHSLTIELRDNARHLRACVWRGILKPKNPEIIKADGREHRRKVRGEKRKRASLLVHGARIAVNDEASEPSAPSLCRCRGEFNPLAESELGVLTSQNELSPDRRWTLYI